MNKSISCLSVFISFLFILTLCGCPNFNDNNRLGEFYEGFFIPVDVDDDEVADVEIFNVETCIGFWHRVWEWSQNNGYTISQGVEGYTKFGTKPENGNLPVTGISWVDAILWCNAYSQILGLEPVYCYGSKVEGLEGQVAKDPEKLVWRDAEGTTVLNLLYNDKANGVRLPTEKEWKAAHDEPNELCSGIVCGYTEDDCCEIKSRNSNANGFFDLCGNVSELCYEYSASDPNDPQSLFVKVMGGSFYHPEEKCTVDSFEYVEITSPECIFDLSEEGGSENGADGYSSSEGKNIFGFRLARNRK